MPEHCYSSDDSQAIFIYVEQRSCTELWSIMETTSAVRFRDLGRDQSVNGAVAF